MEINDWRGKHYSFFCNDQCEFFPCHEGVSQENFSCLFCYCPLYVLGADCGGRFVYLGNGVKDCSQCVLPHRRDQYGYIMKKTGELIEKMKQPFPDK